MPVALPAYGLTERTERTELSDRSDLLGLDSKGQAMVNVIFVHGISVRRADYRVAFARIQEALGRRTSEVTVVPCLWGDEFGAILRGGGASIPRYRETKGIEEEPASFEEQDRWD